MARRHYQNGCLFRRGKNWVMRFREDVLNPDGSTGRVHRSLILGSLNGKKEAREEAERQLRKLNSGTRRPQAIITFEDFWFRYFEPEILPTVKFSTRRLYRALAKKHLLPAFGREKVSEVARVQVQQFIGEKQRRGYSTQTLRHLRNLLGKVFGTLMRWGWLDDNPAKDIELPPMERRRRARVLMLEEITRLSKALAEPMRSLLLLGLLTGLRIGELLALRVEDVDLQRGLLYVHRDVYCGQVGPPKTPDSERSVPLAASLVALLRHYLESSGVKSGWLFPSEVGTPLHDRNVLTRNLWPVCDRLSIPRFSWHSLRHTFSTYSGNSGVPMPILQSLLGHTSIGVTMGYTHALDDVKRQAVEKLAGVLFPFVPNSEDNGTSEARLIQ
jgi:integrase